MYNQQNMNGMCNQQNMNGMCNQPNNMYGMCNQPNNMYGMGCGHNMCHCGCGCGCYNPCQPMPPWHPEPSNHECYKCCEPYREFATYLISESDLIEGQYFIGLQVYDNLQDIITRLEKELEEAYKKVADLEPQLEEAKKKYDECIIECEKHEEEPCHCDCYCEACYNKQEGYCPQCEELREQYVTLEKEYSVLGGIIAELGEQIDSLKGFADMKKKRYELQKVKAEVLKLDANKYEAKYNECKAACEMESGCGCM